ncbi:MAG: hypothetical protein J6Q47_01850 [Paludibacteraceae bacterium]|nr:hypothetical protein [Paludibacteraceae bacterium]
MGSLILVPKAPDCEENEWDRIIAQELSILLIVVYVCMDISICRHNDYSFESMFVILLI